MYTVIPSSPELKSFAHSGTISDGSFHINKRTNRLLSTEETGGNRTFILVYLFIGSPGHYCFIYKFCPMRDIREGRGVIS